MIKIVQVFAFSSNPLIRIQMERNTELGRMLLRDDLTIEVAKEFVIALNEAIGVANGIKDR